MANLEATYSLGFVRIPRERLVLGKNSFHSNIHDTDKFWTYNYEY